MITDKPANFSVGKWKHVSNEAMDFTKRLMEKQKELRMQLNEAIQHPWIVKNMDFINQTRKRSQNDEHSMPLMIS